MKELKTSIDTRSDLEKIDEFYKFLTGEVVPKNIHLSKHATPKMTEKKAFAVIWFLQEHLRILPENIEKCSECGDLYDSNCEGVYWEKKGKNFCGACDHLVPENCNNH